jgi:hypothetical protein
MPDDPFDYSEPNEGAVEAQTGAEPGQPKSCMDADYDSGNPWSDYDWQTDASRRQAASKAHWDSLSPEEQERIKQQNAEFVRWTREWRDTTPRMVEAQDETNRFILRALEKERIDREARASGEASPCSLDVMRQLGGAE